MVSCMTGHRISRLIGLCWLLAGQASVADDYRLWLVLPGTPAGERTEAELGRPLTIQLWYQGPADLDRIDTAPWQTDFAVDQGYAVREVDAQRLRLRLTPRRSGRLSLPPLRLGGAQSDTLPVTVGAALEAGEALQPHWSVSSPQPWQRQELLVELWLDMATSEARLELGSFQPAGVAVQALPVTATIQADSRSRYRYRWLLRPRQAGQTVLTAPVLNYVRDGVPLRRFHFPDTALAVQPLPAYVPPTVPVGRIYPVDTPTAGLFADGIDADDLATALQRAGLPATTARLPLGEPGTHSQARIDWTRANPDPAGVVFFDPQAGRLQTLHPSPPARAWHPAAWALLVALLLVAVWRRRSLAGHLDLWRYRRGLRSRLRRAQDADRLATALLTQPLPGTDTPLRTLHAWATGYRRLYQLTASQARDLATLLERLDQARYGDGEWPPEGAAQLRALL